MDVVGLAIVFIAMLALRCPVAYAMILSSAVSLWMSGLPLVNISQKLASGVDSFPLLAIPMFILAGSLMNTLGITERIFGLASALVRHIPGGLAHVNVMASVIFAGMSGSAIADAGGLGAVEMKAMNDAGYPREVSAAVTAASATIGPVVPPSIAMVIFAFIAEQSLGALFLAGILPGLLMAVLMMFVIYVLSKSGYYALPALPRARRSEVWTAFRRAFLPLLAPTILVLGILLGIFTPTEAGVVVVLYVLVIGIAFLKFDIPNIRRAMIETVRTTAASLFIIAASMIFGWIVVVYRVSETTLELVSGRLDSAPMVMLFIVATMLVLGMFLEGIPAQLLTVPTFMVLASQYGIDPIHLGVVVVLTIMMGALTPPVGLVLYTVMATSGVKIEALVKALWPFYIVLLATILVVAWFPAISLWLPNLLLESSP
jgi:tripartite ATP-independent transporter DctM subunit